MNGRRRPGVRRPVACQWLPLRRTSGTIGTYQADRITRATGCITQRVSPAKWSRIALHQAGRYEDLKFKRASVEIIWANLANSREAAKAGEIQRNCEEFGRIVPQTY